MIILFRKSLAEENEFQKIKEYFSDIIQYRSELSNFSKGKVLYRYSALPFPKELEYDVYKFGLEPVNTTQMHDFVADIRNWYPILKKLTPHTWFDLEDWIKEGPDRTHSFILKGYTNSRKNLWKTHMFAKSANDVSSVYRELLDDSLIGDQGICIREFENFKRYGESIVGLPITKEFRFFVFMGKIVGRGFYWSNHIYDLQELGIAIPSAYEVPEEFLTEIINLVSPNINFWVMDIAQKEDGTWRLVELNDGSMSGLSCVDAGELYSNIYLQENQ